jgi:nitroreductase
LNPAYEKGKIRDRIRDNLTCWSNNWTKFFGGTGAMDVLEAIRTRRSIRSYLAREVEQEKLNQVLEAARLAPSGANRQAYKFIVVRDTHVRKQLAGITRGQNFVAEAPVVIAAVATDPTVTTGSGEPAHRIDIAIAVDHMTLAAHALGLGTCWIGAFDQHRAERILAVPKSMEVVVLLALGYAAKEGVFRGRKPVEEIVSYDRY